MHDGANGECVRDGADADGVAENNSHRENRELDQRANRAHRVTASGDFEHKSVARTGTEPAPI